MPALPFATSSYERTRGDLPPLRIVNMLAEQTPVEEGTVLQSRLGMALEGTTLGSGPIRALYQIDGVMEGARFAVSGNTLYADTTSLGAVTGTGEAKIAGHEFFVFASSGGPLFGWDASTFAEVPLPDSFDVTSLCVGASRLIVIKEETGRFYWSDVLDDNVGALSFATAENSPDKLLDCLFIGDTLILFGSETVEFWPQQPSAALPFQPLVGRTFQTGIKATGCATQYQGAFAWVTNKNQICVASLDNVISAPDLEAKIAASTTVRLWSFLHESTECLAVTLDDETRVFAARTGQWVNFETFGETNWLPRCYVKGVFGSSQDGKLLEFIDGYSDFGGVMERLFTAGQALDSMTFPLMNVTLKTNPGRTTFLTGTYSNPVVAMRHSKDGGFNYSTWKDRHLGVRGEFRRLVQWRSQGFFARPGLMLQFRVTDPVPFRVSGVVINEPYGGI